MLSGIELYPRWVPLPLLERIQSFSLPTVSKLTLSTNLEKENFVFQIPEVFWSEVPGFSA